MKNESISNEEHFLALIRKCGGDVLLQVLADTLLGLSHQELLKELESSRATMITKMENLYECQKNI